MWSCHRAGGRGRGKTTETGSARRGTEVNLPVCGALTASGWQSGENSATGFPRTGEQEEDRREAVRQQTPSRGRAGTGLGRSQEQQEPGTPETPAPLLALPEVFGVTLGTPFSVHSVLVSFQRRVRTEPPDGRLDPSLYSGNQGNKLSSSLRSLFTLLCFEGVSWACVSRRRRLQALQACGASPILRQADHVPCGPRRGQRAPAQPPHLQRVLCASGSPTPWDFPAASKHSGTSSRAAWVQSWSCPRRGAGTFSWPLMPRPCFPSTSPKLSACARAVRCPRGRLCKRCQEEEQTGRKHRNRHRELLGSLAQGWWVKLEPMGSALGQSQEAAAPGWGQGFNPLPCTLSDFSFPGCPQPAPREPGALPGGYSFEVVIGVLRGGLQGLQHAVELGVVPLVNVIPNDGQAPAHLPHRAARGRRRDGQVSKSRKQD